MHIRLILILLFTSLFTVQAQEEVINTAGFKFLDYNFELPKDFLSTKTVVFVSVPPKPNSTAERGDWKALSEEAHKQFRKMGIDAMGYYYIDDIKSGRDATITFTRALKKRNVKNIIFLKQDLRKKDGKQSEQFALVITPFNGEQSLMNHGQKAWKVQNEDIETVFKILGKEVYKAEQPKTNFLITDLPEFFNDADMIYGRRFGVNCRDLKVDKLGIPRFKKIEIPEERPGGEVNNIIEKEIIKYNAQVDQDNLELEEIMKTYPFKYAILDAETDKEFSREGLQYVLLKMHTSAITIRELLNYKMDYSETDYITIKATEYGTTLKSFPVNTPVHKFYVRHLFTKDVYTGARWDADETWQEALQNFIRNMKDEFKID